MLNNGVEGSGLAQQSSFSWSLDGACGVSGTLGFQKFQGFGNCYVVGIAELLGWGLGCSRGRELRV